MGNCIHLVQFKLKRDSKPEEITGNLKKPPPKTLPVASEFARIKSVHKYQYLYNQYISAILNIKINKYTKADATFLIYLCTH